MTSAEQHNVESCQGLVISLAERIHRKLAMPMELQDLIAYGQIGLVQAARDYDSTRNAQFSTYAYYRIRGSIYDGISKMSWASRSEYGQMRQQQLSGELLRADAERSSDEVNPPTFDDELRWFKRISGALAIVGLATLTEHDDDRDPFVDRSTPSPAAAATCRETHRLVHDLIGHLPADAQQLLSDVYFEGLTLQEAADRLGISKSWASRLHAKSLQQLGSRLRLAGVTEAS